MMTCEQVNTYRAIPFSEYTPRVDFFTFRRVTELSKDKSKDNVIFQCRTLGILQSINGYYYIHDLEGSERDTENLLVSMAYYKDVVPSCVKPNTVQIFGTLQRKETPILFVKILQVLNPLMARSLMKAITSIVDNHLAPPQPQYNKSLCEHTNYHEC